MARKKVLVVSSSGEIFPHFHQSSDPCAVVFGVEYWNAGRTLIDLAEFLRTREDRDFDAIIYIVGSLHDIWYENAIPSFKILLKEFGLRDIACLLGIDYQKSKEDFPSEIISAFSEAFPDSEKRYLLVKERTPGEAGLIMDFYFGRGKESFANPKKALIG